MCPSFNKPKKAREIPTKSKERQKSERLGRSAETYACWYLRLCGYSICQTRFRSPYGEIDILARKAGTLAIVEVKARKTERAAQDSLRPKAKKRIKRAAEFYKGTRASARNLAIRYDAIFVLGRFRLVHHKDLWR